MNYDYPSTREDKMKRKSEPKLWIAEVQAYDTIERTWYSSAVISRYAHITRKAGLSDIQHTMMCVYNPKRYTKHEVLSMCGVSWHEIEESFKDFIGSDDDDDSGDNDDTPQIDPAPEDHGVEVPALFCELINGLDLR